MFIVLTKNPGEKKKTHNTYRKTPELCTLIHECIFNNKQ